MAFLGQKCSWNISPIERSSNSQQVAPPYMGIEVNLAPTNLQNFYANGKGLSKNNLDEFMIE